MNSPLHSSLISHEIFLPGGGGIFLCRRLLFGRAGDDTASLDWVGGETKGGDILMADK